MEAMNRRAMSAAIAESVMVPPLPSVSNMYSALTIYRCLNNSLENFTGIPVVCLVIYSINSAGG